MKWTEEGMQGALRNVITEEYVQKPLSRDNKVWTKPKHTLVKFKVDLLSYCMQGTLIAAFFMYIYQDLCSSASPFKSEIDTSVSREKIITTIL
jgi:poly(3-hydroxyalkanoate) synthetase